MTVCAAGSINTHVGKYRGCKVRCVVTGITLRDDGYVINGQTRDNDIIMTRRAVACNRVDCGIRLRMIKGARRKGTGRVAYNTINRCWQVISVHALYGRITFIVAT